MRRRILAAGVALAAACAPADVVREGPPLVVVTIFPVADLTARLAGDAVRVETLLPPRASPATWEASPSQIRLLASASAYVSVGAGLDGWLDDLGSVTEGVRTLRITDGMDLHAADHTHGEGHGHGDADGGDPHVWLDPILVRDGVLPRLEELLVGLAPDAADDLRDRAGALADSLTELDAWIARELAGAPRDGFVATHGAWGYFAERYGLEPMGSLYERPGHEPSAPGLARLVRGARDAGLTTVLAEPQLASSAALALAEELGATVTVIDPLGGPGLTGRESYLDMMRFNGRAFARALGARP